MNEQINRLTPETEGALRYWASRRDWPYLGQALAEIDALRADVATQQTRIKALETALGQYADKRRWGHPFTGEDGRVLAQAFVGAEGPEIAQRALGDGAAGVAARG